MSVALLAFAATSVVRAQDTPASPAPSASMTPMQLQYDGNLHVTLAPYVWLPTIRQNLQYHIPTLPQHGGAPIQSSIQAGPSDYATNINAAAMFAFDVRKGDLDLFGDYIYTNASTNATIFTRVTGPLGHVSIPVTLTTNSRLASSIWEIAAGFSIAHSNNADVNTFVGWRQFPINLTLNYNATIGKRGIINPSGTVTSSPLANDVIFGLRGKVFLGDNHWYVPYYADMGVGAINQTWEAYGGAGYTFNHGQTLLLLYRTLNYNDFPQDSLVQKLTMSGPLIGYTFQY